MRTTRTRTTPARTTRARTTRLVAVLVLAAAGGATLAGCGEERPDDAGARVRDEGQAPAAAARARQVAKAWDGSRAAEVWRAGYHPMEETVRLPEDAFHSAADKEAYAARNFELRGGLPEPTQDKGEVKWESGGSLSLPLMDAREAFDELGAKSAPAPLTVTAMRLGEMKLATSRGQATVPAWLFTLEGYDTPLKRVALDPSELPKAPIGPAADVPSDELGPLMRLTGVSADGRSVTVGAGHGSCDDGAAVDVLETDGSVVLSASVVGATDGACTSDLRVEDVTVRLDRPVGDRVLLDAFTGRPVPLPEGRG
ncbi:hypothetical protein ACWC10_26240 [Streptomyces sp. NPDC001595]|uniref:hypothetical protein n=1 Tax=Streptomyces sp. NPDC001532 TaxID=3154520 RepID=UPI00331F12AB